MATATDILNAVRYTLGESTPSFWTNAELSTLIAEGIRQVVERVPLDALKTLLRTQTKTFDGSSAAIAAPTTDIMLNTVYLTVEESDGNQSEPWDMVTPEVYQEWKARDGEQTQDASDVRIFCVAGGTIDTSPITANYDNGFILYPTPMADRVGYLQFVIKPSESGDMTLPLYLHPLVEYYTIFRAASKKSRDIDMFRTYKALFDDGIGAVTKKYIGMNGLTGVKKIFITDTEGFG